MGLRTRVRLLALDGALFALRTVRDMLDDAPLDVSAGMDASMDATPEPAPAPAPVDEEPEYEDLGGHPATAAPVMRSAVAQRRDLPMPTPEEVAFYEGADHPLANREPDPEPEVEEEGMSVAERDEMKQDIIAALKTIYDPEIPVDIYELGLIYDVAVDPEGRVAIEMTLTSPNCPAAQSLPAEVQTKSEAVSGVYVADVDIVWDPPWDPSRMSEEARLELNL